jgi:hypothetical protein
MEEPQETLWTMHIICASGFFLVSFVADCLFVYSARRAAVPTETGFIYLVPPSSFNFKLANTTLQAILITAQVALSGQTANDKMAFPGGPFIEWCLAFCQVRSSATWCRPPAH